MLESSYTSRHQDWYTVNTMGLSLLEFFWLGFVMAAVPGVVLFETIRRALADRQTLPGFLVGNFVGIALVAALSLFGFSLIANDSTTFILHLFNGALLVYLGVHAIIKDPTKKRTVSADRSNFSTGLLLAVLNPTRFAFWVSLAAQYAYNSYQVGEALLYSTTVLVGSISLFLLLITVLHRIEGSVANHLRMLSITCGIILCCYGVVVLTTALL